MTLKQLRDFLARPDVASAPGTMPVVVHDEYSREEIRRIDLRSYPQTCNLGCEHTVGDVAIVVYGRFR